MEEQEQKQKRDFRIRKLTPRECFRLMDVSEEDIDKIQAAGISKSQQYKMAGNSIVVACLVDIFRQMFRPVFQGAIETPQVSTKDIKVVPDTKPTYTELSLFD